MSSARQLIVNADLISPGKRVIGGAIEIVGRHIAAVYGPEDSLPSVDDVFDARGRMVMPGFIDIHTHGANGVDVCDGGEHSVRELARVKLWEGVTTILPTTLTIGEEALRATVAAAGAYMRDPLYAKAPALHIEGPFINPNCVGAQNPAFVRPPSIDEIDRLRELAPIGVVSVAPEMAGGVDFVRALRDRGIVASAAHTAATYAQFLEAKAAGLTHLTHLCNQMSPLHHREIGMVGAALLDDEVMLEIICDGIHLCPEMIALVFKHKSADRMMLITDSMAASWLPEGPFELGGMQVTVAEGAARLASGVLAGSTLRYYKALQNVYEITGVPLTELVKTTSWNQAQSLGLEKLGKIEGGFIADLVLLNERFEPEAVFVDGQERDLKGAPL